MSDVKALQEQLKALQSQLADAQAAERSQVIDQVRALVSQHNLVAEDIFGKKGRTAKTGAKVAIKYRDGDQTWSGRGIKPRWLQAHIDSGRKLEDFLVA